MKKILILTMLALAGVVNAFAMDDGHVLKDLWRKYQDARKADRPQTEAEILADIKKQALRQHLPVDFYDAATEYVNTVQRRDWKQGDKLREELEADVRRFDQPLVTFLWMRQWKNSSTDELWAYVKGHLKGFQGKNPALYRGVESFLNGALKPFIRNDKEFVLWNLLQSRRYADAMQDEIYQPQSPRLTIFTGPSGPIFRPGAGLISRGRFVAHGEGRNGPEEGLQPAVSESADVLPAL